MELLMRAKVVSNFPHQNRLMFVQKLIIQQRLEGTANQQVCWKYEGIPSPTIWILSQISFQSQTRIWKL